MLKKSKKDLHNVILILSLCMLLNIPTTNPPTVAPCNDWEDLDTGVVTTSIDSLPFPF